MVGLKNMRRAMLGWKTQLPPTIHPFITTPGLSIPLTTSPLGSLQLFIMQEILHFMMEVTNDYAN